ncbi:MAG: glycosyltransferase family 4 protein [Betaproteobacteria bacterium]|nr:glycosyltransferase family 4 protein [Betaproteobacteria bacterium]
MPVKVLLLAKYGAAAASTRHRFFQFLPALEREGIHVSWQALLDDAYLSAMFAGESRPVGPVLAAAIKRRELLRDAGRFDLVVVQYEAYPYLPGFAENGLRRSGVPFVLDLDDAIFHQYDSHRNPLVRSLLGGKIARLMCGAAAVHAGSAYLADYAREAGARRVEFIPTVADTARLAPADSPAGERTGLRIGWIGSPSTSSYLALVKPALREFCARHPEAKVVLIGARPDALDGLPVTRLAWSEEREADDLRSLDIGIMPLADDPWSRGKCGFKLIQYMACGLPVIASPVGANRDIVEPGVNGLLATTTAEWVAALEVLAANDADRAHMGRAGRESVLARYSLEAVLPRIVASFRDAAAR